jgi:hypothetical protein
MGTGFRSLGGTANRLLAAIAIAASTGALVTVLSDVGALAHPEPHVTFVGIILSGVWLGVMGALFGAVLGTACAFIALLTVLREFNPWATVVPLVIGASCGLALGVVIITRFPGHTLYAYYSVSILSATAGGFVASFITKSARRTTRGRSNSGD